MKRNRPVEDPAKKNPAAADAKKRPDAAASDKNGARPRMPSVSARSVAWLATLVMFGLGLLTLAGRVLGIDALQSVIPNGQKMSVITAALFVLMAVQLACMLWDGNKVCKSLPFKLPGLLVGAVGLFTAALYAYDIVAGSAPPVGGVPVLKYLWVPSSRLALLTALLFMFSGVSLTLLSHGGRRTSDASHVLMLPVVLLGYLVVMSYVFGIETIHEFLGVAVALNTGLAFIAFSISVFCMRTDTWLIRPLTGDGFGSIMSRRMLPPLLALPVIIGWFRIMGERYGVFSSEVGVILVALAYTACFFVLVWLTSRSLNVLDDKRRAAVRTTLEGKERFRAMADGTPVLISVSRASDGRYLYVNRAYERAFGYPEGELVGGPAVDQYTDQSDRDRLIADLREKGRLENYELRVRRRDGTTFWVATWATPLNYGGEKAIMGTSIDVTERKRYEKTLGMLNAEFKKSAAEAKRANAGLRDSRKAALNLMEDALEAQQEAEQASKMLRQSEVRYRRLFESAKDGILILDADTGQIIDINPFLIDLLGYSRDQYLEKKVWELGFLKDIAANKDNFEQLKRMGYVRYEDRPLKTADGRRINVEFVSNVYLLDTKNVIQCNIRDITERKKAEEELRMRTEELNRTVKDLARSNENLEQFAYVASHDLQEPLRTMSSYSQLIEKKYRDKLDSDANEYIDFIVGAAARMQALISDLLAYSRVGRKDGEAEQIDCNRLVRKVVKMMTPGVEAAGGRIEVGDLPVIVARGPGIAQVFQNLIGNAIKFRGPDPPEIRISAAKEGAEWVFSVQDNGIGIDPKFFDKIFLMFQRLHTREEYPGTGIGLTICKKIVESHGGRIWVESEPGKGATFKFSIPAADEKGETPTPPAANDDIEVKA